MECMIYKFYMKYEMYIFGRNVAVIYKYNVKCICLPDLHINYIQAI